jgi:NADH:ubiquinone oxidoreductase subunit 3 (subunit A)
MLNNVWLSPPVAFMIFFGLTYGLYKLGGWIAASGEHHEDKHLAYTGGEAVPPPTTGRFSYHVFFRLALLFAILHVATLVLSTLPGGISARRAASVYAVGIAISVLVLVRGEA